MLAYDKLLSFVIGSIAMLEKEAAKSPRSQSQESFLPINGIVY